ncbi:hypothetical protein HDU91_000717, partial [Kappamyces sp. JEL0680]
LSLNNAGVVAVDWAFSFPNDADVEIERWADPGDLTEEQTVRNFILDNCIFGVSPKSGKLEPGQTVTILFSYSHEFAGPHRLPVLFKLRNGTSRTGKEILINFIGYSVPPTQKFLHLQSINHELAPVNIGTVIPPIQYYRMMNRGTSQLQYSVDTSTIARMNSDNMDFAVLKCLKTQGVIPPGGIEYLEFIFNPLEEKEYELDLPITVDQGKTRMITLRGRGIREEAPLPGTPFMDPRILKQAIPLIPTLPPLLNTGATLSLERVDFGHVPIRSVLRQIIVVSNTTESDDITARWKIPSVWPADTIKVTPPSKRLRPGESQVFKITFQPDERPRLYNFDLNCEVVNETLLEHYFSASSAVEEQKQQAELMPGESSAKLPLHAVSSAAGPNLKTLKYKKLPSISSLQGSPVPGAKPASNPHGMGKHRDNSCADLFPSIHDREPVPSVFYIGLRAQSHSVEEFRELFSRYSTFFTPKRTGFPTTVQNVTLPATHPC